MEETQFSLGKCTPDSLGVFAREQAVGVDTRGLPHDRQSLGMAFLDRVNSAWMESMKPEQTEQ